MTIAAGVLCDDGIVICADSEITKPSLKVPGYKVFQIGDQANFSAAFTGAGDYDLIRYAVQHCERLLRDTHMVRSHEELRASLEDVVSAIYQKHVWTAPWSGDPANHPLHFWLLVAYWTPKEGCVLFKTSLGTCQRVTGYEALGSGGDIGDYILGVTFTFSMSVYQAAPACAHMIHDAKSYAHGVGGRTDMVILHDDGRMEIIDKEQVQDYERVFEEFTNYYSTLALMTCDIRIHQDDVDRTIEDFAFKMKSQE